MILWNRELRRRPGRPGQAETLDQSQAQVAGAVMPFHHGQFQNVLGGDVANRPFLTGAGQRRFSVSN